MRELKPFCNVLFSGVFCFQKITTQLKLRLCRAWQKQDIKNNKVPKLPKFTNNGGYDILNWVKNGELSFLDLRFYISTEWFGHYYVSVFVGYPSFDRVSLLGLDIEWSVKKVQKICL